MNEPTHAQIAPADHADDGPVEPVISLLIREPGAARSRLVRAPRIPFTLGNASGADIPIVSSEGPVRVRITKLHDGYVAHNLVGTRPGDPLPSLRLRNGTKWKTAGVRVQFLTESDRVAKLLRGRQDVAVDSSPGPDDRLASGAPLNGDAPLNGSAPLNGNAPLNGSAPRNGTRRPSLDGTESEATASDRGDRLSSPVEEPPAAEPPVDSGIRQALDRGHAYLDRLRRLREALDAPPTFLQTGSTSD